MLLGAGRTNPVPHRAQQEKNALKPNAALHLLVFSFKLLFFFLTLAKLANIFSNLCFDYSHSHLKNIYAITLNIFVFQFIFVILLCVPMPRPLFCYKRQTKLAGIPQRS